MELKDKVANIKLSKELRDLGYPQEGLFWWIIPTDSNLKPNPKNKRVLVYDEELCTNESCGHKPVIAPTVAELGVWLPRLFYKPEGAEPRDMNISANTEANARAKLLIWLVENKYVSFDKDGQTKRKELK